MARFDIADRDGKVIVEKDKRINAKHLRDLAAGGIQRVSVPEDFLYGRVLAKNIVDPDTGEVVAHANDEITESVLNAMRAANVRLSRRCTPTTWIAVPTFRRRCAPDETADQMAARVAIYRMMRPGEPPTEEAVEALFQRLFYSEETYDLSRVGRMKVNSRLGRGEIDSTGPMTLTNEDILETIKVLVELRNGRGQIDDIDHLGNRRACVVSANWPRTSSALAWCVSSAPSRKRLGQAETENLMPHDLINSKPISAAIKEFFGFEPAVAVHGPDQPAVGNHAQASRFRTEPGRPDARTRRL